MTKRNIRGIIVAIIYILLGCILFWRFNKIGGAIILIGGLGMSLDVMKWLKTTWDFLNSIPIFGEKTNPKMERSPGAIQQTSDRDSIVKYIINAEKVIFQSSAGDSSVSFAQPKETTITNKKEDVLREIYYKMINALKLLNLAANIGLKNKEEFERIDKVVEDFIEIKIKHEIDLNTEIKNKFDQVMGSFRHTKHELFLKLEDGKFNEGLHGLNSFDFIIRCKEATEEIKKRLDVESQKGPVQIEEKLKIYNKLYEILRDAFKRNLSRREEFIFFTGMEIKEIKGLFRDHGYLLSSQIYDLWNGCLEDEENKGVFLVVDSGQERNNFLPLKIDKKFLGLVKEEFDNLKLKAKSQNP